jgi:MFS transporter, MHS family, proline/betaine transporter
MEHQTQPSPCQHKLKRSSWAALFATALDHYDVALYGFMAPVLVEVFLPMLETVPALILAYCITPLGMLSRPLGALIIGNIGDKLGRKKALSLAVWGMALTTTCIGFLPTYAQVGALAPILFAIFKLIQDFFLAGSYSGGAIFALEHARLERKGWWSGVYISATVIGILLASLAATIVAYLPVGYWRIAYIAALATGGVAVYIRKYAIETPEFLKSQAIKRDNTLKNLKANCIRVWPSVFCTILVSFCYSTLTKMVQVFMNVFILQVTSIPLKIVMTVHTLGLLLFLIVLPFFGSLADRIGLGRSMLYGALATLCLSFPLFKLLEYDSLVCIVCMKFAFVILSAWFVAPFHAWAHSLFAVQERYTFVSLGYAIGSRIGSCMIPLALYLWNHTHLSFLPCLVLMIGSALGAWGLIKNQKLSHRHRA